MSLRRYAWRSLWQRPGRALLTVLSIVIGVAAIVSFAMTTDTTRGAYKQMFSLVTGRTSLEVTTDGPGGLDPELEERVRQIPGVEVVVPTLQRMTVVYAGGKRARLQLLGIDPARDQLVRDYEVTSGRNLEGDDELLIDRAFAERLGIEVGQDVKLLSRRGLKPIEVVGLVEAHGGSALQQAGAVFVTIKKAQSLFGAKGRIDRLQIVVPPDQDVDEVQRAVAAILPEGVEARAPNMSSQLMDSTLASADFGLRLASVFSLLSASFIILNTFLMNVSERRRQFAILRAIGATGRQVLVTVLGESTLLGLIGSVVGVAAGMGIAKAFNQVLAHVMQLDLPAAELGFDTIAIAVACGFGMSFCGAFIPALHAARISPLEGLDRVSRADLDGRVWPYVLSGAALTLGAGGIVIGTMFDVVPIMVALYASPFLLIGIVMLSTLVMSPLSHLVAAALHPFAGISSRLALRQVLRHRARTTLTSGVLFVSAATGVGIAYSILDNLQDVRDWYRRAIQGDFFVRAMMPDMATGQTADLPAELDEEIRQVPRITSVTVGVMLEARIDDTTVILVGREFPPAYPLPLDLVAGHEGDVRRGLDAGGVVVGSVLASRLKLGLGDHITIDSGEGKFDLPIVGVTNDYMVGGLSAYLSVTKIDQMYTTHGIDGYAIRVEPEAREEVRKALQEICDRHGVLLHSFADVATQIEWIMNGIVGCLWGLIVLGFVVGAFGVVNTIAMNVLEQTRELGLLRIVAMTRPQVRRTILSQALIMAGVGLVPGISGGLLVAYILTSLSNRSVGHEIDFGLHPILLAVTFFGALGMIMGAAWVPAQRAAHLDAVRALHYE